MPAEQLMLRLLSINANVELQNLRTGNLTNDNWQLLHNTIKSFREYKLFIDDTGGVTVNTLRTKLRRLKGKHPEIKLAVIDYIQIMSSSSSRDRHMEVSDMTRGLKLLARELKMPIIALSQLNRSLEQRNDKRPIMSDLRESGAIEQDADIILFVYRDAVYRMKAEKEKEVEARKRGEKYAIEEEETDYEDAEIIIGKQRNGPTGIVKLTFKKSLTKFIEIDEFSDDINHYEQDTQINGLPNEIDMPTI